MPLDQSSPGESGPTQALWKDQRGFSRLETAIIFLAFALLGAGFIYFVLNTSVLAAGQSRVAVLHGLEVSGDSLRLIGSTAGLTNPDKTSLDVIRFRVTNGSTLLESIDLSSNRTVFTYIDAEQVVRVDQPYWSAIWITGWPNVLNPGETVDIKVNLRGLNIMVGTSKEFTLQLSPDRGATLALTMTTPSKFKKFTVELKPEQKTVDRGR